ncbi:hypothetical protein C8K11_1152 [Novosphingobium sp. GV055]|uniref:hypothetical protein n=1 Tax=Novosphingobium sp. GV055 TaxID=2135690 RepID=UPI000D41B864|nr:hypothetical protein [Novosphingobium sp. GV055]PTR07530.1 hypothetical protein C8K11_1152 [Novosphingobium sp. GV055]PUB00232.1 hypothetical protein C8K12_1152 [Novosphingobium sp. GV061]PUB15273.1 hypothetical protein C8K14_1152 [Novosphingobium sp. GV079]PUB39149.1 hypothetical protein C8K10_1152 [Novosphingobium sp. GV027]
MPTTTVVALDGTITTTDANWPLLAYDDQVNAGTMLLWDPSIAAQWPTAVIGGAVNAGDSWKNLSENFADGIQQSGVMPVYDATGAQFAAATTGSIYWPAGLFDLKALDYPNFAMTCWGKMPANPVASGTHRLFGFGNTTGAMSFGAWYNYNNTPLLGLSAVIDGSGSSSADATALINKAFCIQMTCADAGSGQRKITIFLNNAQIAQVTKTPALAAQPTVSFGLGKATSAFAGPDDAKFSRLIMENCSISGFDPEVRRQAEWKAKHAVFGL